MFMPSISRSLCALALAVVAAACGGSDTSRRRLEFAVATFTIVSGNGQVRLVGRRLPRRWS